MPLDPAFPDFIDLCRRREMPFAIVSDGLRWYIEYIFSRHGLRDIPIYACEIRFQNPGYSFEFPYFHASTPLNGTSKRFLVQAYSRHYQPVIFIGDGHNDIKAAEVAGRVYARDRLLESSRQRKPARHRVCQLCRYRRRSFQIDELLKPPPEPGGAKD